MVLFSQRTARGLRTAAAIAFLGSAACTDESPASMSPSTSAMVPPAAGAAGQSAGAGTASPAGAGASASAGAGAAGTFVAGTGGNSSGDAGMPDASVACRIPDNLPVTAQDADGGVDPKCRDIPRTIFAENCIGGFCHNARELPSGNLNLMSACVADRLLDRSSSCQGLMLIDSEHAEQSFLLDKLQNEQPRCGASMPDGWHLPPDQVACVTAWVNAVIRAAR